MQTQIDAARAFVLKAIIKDYPKVENYKIHEAKKYSLACDRRLRALKDEGVVYEYDRTTKCYIFKTSLRELKKLLPKKGRK